MREAHEPDACEDRIGDLVDLLTGYADPARAAEFAEHRAACAGCRREAAELADVVTLLRATQPAPAGQPAEPADRRVNGHGRPVRLTVPDRPPAPDRSGGPGPRPPAPLTTRPGRRRHRRRVFGVTGAAIAALAAAAAVVVLMLPAQPTTVDFATRPPGSVATVSLQPAGDGTRLRLRATGLAPDTDYVLWLAEGDGTRTRVGTVHTDGRGAVQGEMVAGLPMDRAVRVWATDPAGATVLAAPVPH